MRLCVWRGGAGPDSAQSLDKYFGRNRGRFDNVAVHGELFRLLNISIFALVGEDDNLRTLGEVLLPYRLEHFKTGHPRHNEIQKDGIRSGLALPERSQEVFAASEHRYLVTGVLKLNRIEVKQKSVIINEINP